MPTITLSKERLENLVGKSLGDEVLKDRVAMLGTDVEGIDGDEFTVEVFPNRPDMLSEEGLSRALQGFLNLKKGLVRCVVNRGDYKVVVDKKMEKFRPYISFFVVKGYKFNDASLRSFIQLQDKMARTFCKERKKAAMGAYDLDTLAFPIQYKTVPSTHKYVPLGFKTKMTAGEVMRRHPKGIEYAHLSKSDKEFAAFLDAKGNMMCQLPFTQAEFSKLTPDTENMLIEITGDDWKTVAQTTAIFAYHLYDGGGKIYSVEINYPYKTPVGKKVVSPLVEPRKMKFSREYINKILGLELSEKEVKDYLERMRFGVEKGEALVPAYRTDVLHQIDLAEDVAIAYGYENFEPVIPNVSTIGEESRAAIIERKLAEVLVGLGMLEVNTYHLTNEETLFNKMERPKKKVVKAISAVNENYNSVRDSLVPGLLQVLSENKHHEYPQNLFDIGTAVDAVNGITEKKHLALVLSSAKTDFTMAKSALGALFTALGQEYSLKPAAYAGFLEGRAGSVIVNGKVVGVVGEIHPQVLNNFELELPVAAIELELGFVK